MAQAPPRVVDIAALRAALAILVVKSTRDGLVVAGVTEEGFDAILAVARRVLAQFEGDRSRHEEWRRLRGQERTVPADA